jgi:alanyl-tRNA synthetase
MITNRELLDEIKQLTKEQSQLKEELEQIKEMNQQQNNDQSNSQNETSQGNEFSNIAEDLLKLKGLINNLENKMHGYISKNANNNKSSLGEEDVINLILTMMDGMMEWTLDYVSKQNNQSNQLQ